MHQEHKNNITENKLKQLKSQVWSPLMTSGLKTRVGLFSKEKVSKELDN